MQILQARLQKEGTPKQHGFIPQNSHYYHDCQDKVDK